MKVALYGGSFNPPHICHVLTAAWVRSTRSVDRVWFVPTYRHAFGKQLIEFDARCELVERAIAPLGKWAAVSRVEAELDQESRTIDTVRHLERVRPDLQLSLVIGADILLEAHQWKAFDELQAKVPFHVIGRTGVTVPGREFALELPDVSSTELRRRLQLGDVDYAAERIPLATLDGIVERGLYGIPDAARTAWLDRRRSGAP